jgi:molybdate transport system substrate-binding protein
MRTLLAALLMTPIFHASAADLHVLAAASLTDAMKEIGAGFENQTGIHVSLNFGASSLLARQIEEGAPADVFLSADEAKMDQLRKDGLIEESSRQDLLGNSLVLIVPADSSLTISTAAELLRPEIRKIALADPAAVPAGIYTREFLIHDALWEKLKAKIVPTENVRAALAAVEAGNADAAFVYKTDAAISKKVRVIFTPPEKDAPAIRYPMAIVKETKNRATAGQFLTYLRSNAAAAVFERFGFVVRR